MTRECSPWLLRNKANRPGPNWRAPVASLMRCVHGSPETSAMDQTTREDYINQEAHGCGR